NVISDNEGPAIIYETSYNAVIAGNTILRNNWADGRRFVTEGDPFPVAAVYVSESGGEPRVPARTDKLGITVNRFTDNWSGITLWENADRFCNSPHNTSSGYCTLLVDDVRQCRSPAIQRKPLLDDCRWKTKRVDIHHNRFEVDPVKLGCEHLCARMAVHRREHPAGHHGASGQRVARQRLRRPVALHGLRHQQAAGTERLAIRAAPPGPRQRLLAPGGGTMTTQDVRSSTSAGTGRPP